MKIGVIIYAFHLVAPLQALLGHVLIRRFDTYLFLHSQDPAVVKVCEWAAEHLSCHYYDYGENRGLAKSANEGLLDGYERDGCDVVLTMNDDACPGTGDIERITALAVARPDAYIVEGYGRVGDREEALDTACAAITPRALAVLGMFDENCYPAYYEDSDYHRRALLAGLPRVVATDTYITHQGSASLPTVPAEQHHAQFKAVQSYYLKKWHGDRGQERAVVPFGDSRFNLRIEAKDRHHPYGEYDR